MDNADKLKELFVEFAKQGNLTDAVFNTIVESIHQSILPSGMHLSSIELADIFGISRTPVQIALSKLEYAGLLRLDRRNSFITYTLDLRERIDYNDCMVGLYDIAARIAQKRIDSYYKNLLGSMLDSLDKLLDAPYRYLEEDTNFHYNIILSTANRDLIKTFTDLQRKYGLAYLNEESVREPADFAAKHQALNRRLYEAILGGNRTELDEVCAEHDEQMMNGVCTWISRTKI